MIKRLWHTHRAALLAFVVALGALGYFAINTISTAIYWMDPAHQEQPLAGWMTPRYVAQSYGLPREYLVQALFIPPNAPPRRVSLDTIAEENNLSLAELQARIDDAAARFKADREARRND